MKGFILASAIMMVAVLRGQWLVLGRMKRGHQRRMAELSAVMAQTNARISADGEKVELSEQLRSRLRVAMYAIGLKVADVVRDHASENNNPDKR